jgi:hypothetical protein
LAMILYKEFVVKNALFWHHLIKAYMEVMPKSLRTSSSMFKQITIPLTSHGHSLITR